MNKFLYGIQRPIYFTQVFRASLALGFCNPKELWSTSSSSTSKLLFFEIVREIPMDKVLYSGTSLTTQGGGPCLATSRLSVKFVWYYFSNNHNNLYDNNHNLVLLGIRIVIASPLRAINFKKLSDFAAWREFFRSIVTPLASWPQCKRKHF